MSLVTLKIGNFRSLEVGIYEVKDVFYKLFHSVSNDFENLKESCVEHSANDR